MIIAGVVGAPAARRADWRERRQMLPLARTAPCRGGDGPRGYPGRAGAARPLSPTTRIRHASQTQPSVQATASQPTLP